MRDKSQGYFAASFIASIEYEPGDVYSASEISMGSMVCVSVSRRSRRMTQTCATRAPCGFPRVRLCGQLEGV